MVKEKDGNPYCITKCRDSSRVITELPKLDKTLRITTHRQARVQARAPLWLKTPGEDHTKSKTRAINIPLKIYLRPTKF